VGTPFIEFRNVTVMRDDIVALDRLDLRIEEGERVAVLGPNGAGKSTLVQALTREVYPLAGGEPSSLHVYGRERWDLFELRSLLGIVTSELVQSCTGRYTALETVLSGFFGSIGVWRHHHVTDEMRAQAREALELMQLSDLAARRLTEMSSGQVRRAVIARALVNRPRALLLDEPTTSLDVRGKREMRAAIANLARSGASVVLVTHQLEDIVPEIGRVVTLRRGRVLHDGPAREVLREGPLRELFGDELTLHEIGGVRLLL
jgi:iron complex transport system ATP-binding protein